MEHQAQLTKCTRVTADFVIQKLRPVSKWVHTASEHVYLHGLLLGLPFHPRISGRLFEVARDGEHNDLKVDGKTWEDFANFILNDHKLAGAICGVLLTSIGMVAFTTYNADPVVSRVALVAILPPIFGIAQTACTRWHLKSMYKQQDAQLNWCKATAGNAHSPFINTSALLSAPFAWMGWSIISFTVLIFTILFRGLRIIPCTNPQGSCPVVNGLAELANLIFACHSQESTRALVGFSIVLRMCLSVTAIVGGVHFFVTATYFTRLCLPQAASPARNADVASVSTAREQEEVRITTLVLMN